MKIRFKKGDRFILGEFGEVEVELIRPRSIKLRCLNDHGVIIKEYDDLYGISIENVPHLKFEIHKPTPYEHGK